MGIGSFFRRLVGAEAAAGPLTGAMAGDLRRLWTARETLGPQTRNQTLDELCRRGLPVPFAEIPGIYAPAAMGLDDLLDLQSLIELLRSQDPNSGNEHAIRIGRTSVIVPSGEREAVLVVLPGWRENGKHAPAPPPLEDERIVAIISAGCDDDVARAVAAHVRAGGVPLHRVEDLDAPLHIGELTISAIADAPGVVELIDDDDVFRVLVGAAIPLHAVPGPPETTHIIGAFRLPPTERDTEALEQAEWEPANACDIEACVLLSDVAQTSGYKSQALAMALLVPTRTLGHGLPVNAEAQPLLDAALRGDAEAVARLGAEASAEARAEVWHHLIIEGRMADAARIVELAPDEPDARYRRGVTAELSGDLSAAREAYESAVTDVEEPHPRSLCQLVWLDARDRRLTQARERAETTMALLPDDVLANANVALLRWLQGERDEAFAQLQTGHVTVGSWLGPLLESVVHDADPETAQFGLYSLAAFEMAPFVTALDHLRAGDAEEGERLLRRSLEIEPRHAAALGQLVLFLEHSGRDAEALALADETLKRLPQFAYLRAIRGVLHLSRKRDAEAVEDLGAALAVQPDHADWRINRVQALTRLGRVEEARADLAVLEEGGTDRVLVVSLGRALGAASS